MGIGKKIAKAAGKAALNAGTGGHGPGGSKSTSGRHSANMSRISAGAKRNPGHKKKCGKCRGTGQATAGHLLRTDRYGPCRFCTNGYVD